MNNNLQPLSPMLNDAAYKKRWIALGFLILSLLVIALDNTVLNLALPSISDELGTTASGLQWIVDAYVLVFASLLLTLGSIGDRFGRKKVLQIGLIVFGLFSLGAALSRSTMSLTAMRAMMGIGGAAIMPSTLSILTATFHDPRERAQAIAFWTATFALGTGIGPLVGGWLLKYFHWSSVFYINLPVVVIAVIGGQFFIPDSRAEKPRSIDIPGCILSMSGLFALVYGIIQAGIDSWTAPSVLWAFGAAVVLLSGFALWERHVAQPMLPLHFFKNMSFTGANLTLTLVAFSLFGVFFFMSQYLQSVHGYTPLQAGIRLLPMAGAAFIGSASSARLAQRINTKFTVFLGVLVAATGLYYFYRISGIDTNYGLIVIGMCITAIGIGMTMSPATNSIMGSIPVDEAGVGSAMNDTTRQIGGALGVAIMGTLLNSAYIAKIDAVKWPVPLPAQVTDAIRGSIQGAHIAAQKLPSPALTKFVVDQANQAFTDSMAHALLVTAIIMTATAVMALFIIPGKIRPYHEEKQRPPKKANKEK
ncbi:MAG TPA: MFS transporter [Dehalococcoidales bacterium]|nr:MFS transporter [Dehalococcoidales bacterium]